MVGFSFVSTIWGFSRTLESLNSLTSLDNGLFWKTPFPKKPFFPNPRLSWMRLIPLKNKNNENFVGRATAAPTAFVECGRTLDHSTQPRSPGMLVVQQISEKIQEQTSLDSVPLDTSQLRQALRDLRTLLIHLLWNSDHGKVTESTSQSILSQEPSEESHRIGRSAPIQAGTPWFCWTPAREPKIGKPPKVLLRVLSQVLSEIGVLPEGSPECSRGCSSCCFPQKEPLESTPESTPDSTQISGSTPEGTLGTTFGGSLGSLAGRQTLHAFVKTFPAGNLLLQRQLLWSAVPKIYEQVATVVLHTWILSSRTQRPNSVLFISCNACEVLSLAAQCERPPHVAQYPFEIVSQRGVSHPFALFS